MSIHLLERWIAEFGDRGGSRVSIGVPQFFAYCENRDRWRCENRETRLEREEGIERSNV